MIDEERRKKIAEAFGTIHQIIHDLGNEIGLRNIYSTIMLHVAASSPPDPLLKKINSERLAIMDRRLHELIFPERAIVCTASIN